MTKLKYNVFTMILIIQKGIGRHKCVRLP